MKKILSVLLTFALLFNMNVFSFAASVEKNSSPNDKNSEIESNADLKIDENGVYINGIYYTKSEFASLLRSAIKIDVGQTRSALAIGSFFIPGIGQVLITAAGTIILAGAVVEVGTWLYDQIVEWFENGGPQEAYDEAKENGEPTENHSTQTSGSLSRTGNPYSSKDKLNPDGSVKQRRYYDGEGNADMDIDYNHTDCGTHVFPHRHDWNGNKRGDWYV